jgi:uncharacterized protein YyaL (SSP411 family)
MLWAGLFGWLACWSPEAASLADSTSPYLRQHASDPVQWRIWSDAAFDEARRTQRPVFLSIGYSSCHWCHVMHRESFTDPRIAALLNERFVSIKVDREERPDIDAIYLAAVNALTGRGGWPMTLVLTPDTREVLFAATYLPARDGDRGMARGLESVLTELADRWEDGPEAMRTQAEGLSRFLVERSRPRPSDALPGPEAVTLAVDDLLARADRVHGGFTGAPKFPRPNSLRLLLLDGRPAAVEHVRFSVEQMAGSALRDQLGGGWHRYTVDEAWSEPHFEKMLYDQALMANLLVDGSRVDPQLQALLDETLDSTLRDFALPRGGLASSFDADSLDEAGRSVEGAAFTWTADEVRSALPDGDATWAIQRLGLDGPGPFEGRHALAFTPLNPLEKESWPNVRRVLVAHRARRSPPARDDKLITAWNAYAVSALARAGLLTADARRVQQATTLAEAVLSLQRRPDGRLARSSLDGQHGPEATLEDLAAMTAACLDVYEASGDARWIHEAATLHREVQERFADPAGGWYQVADASDLLWRPRPVHEGVEPSADATAAHNALRLAAAAGVDDQLGSQADRALIARGAALLNDPSALPTVAAALAVRHRGLRQLVVVRPSPSTDDRAFVALGGRDPHVMVFRAVDGDTEPPVVAGKWAGDDRVTAYLCEAGRCLAPTTDPEVLAANLDALRRR